MFSLVLGSGSTSLPFFASFSGPGGTSLPHADAQTSNDVSIQTSMDDASSEKSFFGHAIIRVTIRDESADNDAGEEVTVRIDADGASSDSITAEVPDTSEGSGRFEFFLMHSDSIFDLDELDPENNDLAGGMSGAGPRAAPVITFGTGAALETGESVFSDVEFKVEYESEEVGFRYEEARAELSADRQAYGSNNIVHLSIHDFDANLNPTRSDEFMVLEEDMSVLFDLDGGTFKDAVQFEESGTNTAIFEAEITLTPDIAAEDPSDIGDQNIDFLEWSSSSTVFNLNDMANYDEDIDNDGGIDVELDDPEVNDSGDTSEVSIVIEDLDGEIELQSDDLTFASEMKLVLTDNDQNRDSENDDELTGIVTVTTEKIGGDQVVLGMKETNDNSGIFAIDLPNKEMEITFCAMSEIDCPDSSNSVLELREEDIPETIALSYTDSLDDDSKVRTFRAASFELRTTVGVPSSRPMPGYLNEVLLSIYDPDLDDNARAKDVYSFTLLGTDPAPLKKSGGLDIGNLAEFEVIFEDEAPNYDGSRTFTLRETDIHTGNFTAQISATEYQDIANLLDPLGDQEKVELVYHDNMEDPDRETTFDFRLGHRFTPIFFSRDMTPIPGADLNFDGDPDPVKLTWIMSDVAFNDTPNAEESIPLLGILFKIEMIKSNGDRFVMFDRFTNHLSDILVEVPTSLVETGKDTSLFSTDLEFKMGGEFLEPEDWQDAELRITYIEDSIFLDDDRNNSVGMAFTGHTGVLSTNSTSTRSGQMIYVTVQDNDLNLDDDELDSFESSIVANSDSILTVETERQDLGGVTTEIFRETGPDSGVFQAAFEVGKDIPVTEFASGDNQVDQASRILITYDDKLDGTGRDGEEMEISIPIISSTGSIQVFPELVGPATKIVVTIADADLDQKSAGTDTYESDANSGFVEFRSDRNGIGTANPDLDETGPSTGLFTFEIELVTDEENCEDNDLGEIRFDAVGGAKPSIGACPGDTLLIKYQDESDASLQSTVVSKIIDISSYDPIFATEMDRYEVGHKITVVISDPDANRDPDAADSLTDIKLTSPSDLVGKSLSALETGKDTGLFAFSFLTSLSSQTSAIFVKPGENVTISYTDQFPADFEDEQSDRDFSFPIHIDETTGQGTMTSTQPWVKDAIGNNLAEISVGQQIILSTQVRNNNDAPVNFVALIEVRDSASITQFLAWQTATLDSDGSIEVGLSWTPDIAGTYSVRTFAINSLSKPQILSEVETSDLIVSR
jgi:hypothetical protein